MSAPRTNTREFGKMLGIAGIEFDRSLGQRHGLGEAIPGIGM